MILTIFYYSQNGEVVVPPSPNWFLLQAISARAEDGLLAAAAFKTIVVYQIDSDGTPKVLRVRELDLVIWTYYRF